MKSIMVTCNYIFESKILTNFKNVTFRVKKRPYSVNYVSGLVFPRGPASRGPLEHTGGNQLQAGLFSGLTTVSGAEPEPEVKPVIP